MKKYIGPISKENFKAKVLVFTNWSSNIFIFLILTFPIAYILFYTGIIGTRNISFDFKGDRTAVGAIVDESGDSYCTAFLVQPNVLLTARHCCMDKDDLPSYETFYVNFTQILEEGYDFIPAKLVYYPESKDDDYAILKLDIDTLIGIEPLELMGADEIENPKAYNPEVDIYGYPSSVDVDWENNTRNVNSGDQKKIPSTVVSYYQENGDITEFEIKDRIHGGNSGGPVIDKEQNKVIGIATWVSTSGKQEGQSYCEKVSQILTDPNINESMWQWTTEK